MSSDSSSDIAIISMVGRFPGARNVDELWELLRTGKEGLSTLSEADLRAAGVSDKLLADPAYVRVQGLLHDVDQFDAAFFGMSPREAELLDPQHRAFLECCFETLETAGYLGSTYKGEIGVFGGAGGGATTYLLNNLMGHRDLRESVGDFQLFIANDKDSLTTRVSYKLNLHGPSMAIQTACSTSLVAVCMAVQSLLSYQCDLALAGGVTINVPHNVGYLFQEGMIYSPDGHCRAFDEKAAGTVSSSAVGVVALKRLEDAIADGDTIHAVIKGTALNNDGAAKVGFTAPSMQGQAKVIAQALAVSEVPAESISYVETHGTATPSGDPIELAALTQAFRASTRKRNFCAIGSVKTNLGHTDAAAGVAGLIKTVLALSHRQLPASLHFEKPNPKIDFASSPFFVNTELRDWVSPDPAVPLRAGVSAFGIGGTNAHVILEQAPPQAALPASRGPYVLPLSARSTAALDQLGVNLAAHLRYRPEIDLGDAAFTLQAGRKGFEHRRVIIANDRDDALEALDTRDSRRVFTEHAHGPSPQVVFMFSGQASEYVQMGAQLYEREPTFRKHLDRCAELLRADLGVDLRTVLYPQAGQEATAKQLLQQISISMPAIFAVEFALAQMWLGWGVKPAAMLGLSIGEYAAACLAGVFRLEDALHIIAIRGRLMQSTAPGGMLSLNFPVAKVHTLLGPNLSLAVVLGPENCAVSGPAADIDVLAAELTQRDIEHHRLALQVAPHSALMNPILDNFRKEVSRLKLSAPQIPYLSNVTGTWITAEQAVDADYWVKHLQKTVRLEAVQEFLGEQRAVLLEVGPGRGLASAAKRHPARTDKQVTLATLRHPGDAQPDLQYALTTLARLWAAGVEVAWTALYKGAPRRRVALPPYPFERQRHWVEPVKYERRGARSGPELVGHSFARAWINIYEAGAAQAEGQLAQFKSPAYEAKVRALNWLSVGYVHTAMRVIGAFDGAAAPLGASEILTRCGVSPNYLQLLGRSLDALVSHGLLQSESGRYSGLTALPPGGLPALLAAAKMHWADNLGWVEVVNVCGPRYAEILVGDTDPRELLFGDDFYDKLQGLYRDSSDAVYFNGIIRALLSAAVTALPQNQKIRILEVGAGTGATTEYLLPVLPPQRTQYVYTDIGAFFISRAKERFARYAFLSYELLDLDRSPQEQGYAFGSFDVIVAANVLHATRNLGNTLTHVRSLLAPGGVLLLYEATQFPPYFDVAFPLLQQFDEGDLRNGQPFLSVVKWRTVLLEHGFERVSVVPDVLDLDGNIFLARANMAAIAQPPREAAPTIPLPSPEPGLSLSLRPKLSNQYVAPSTDLEQTIVGVWEKCLGVQRIGVEDNFFELGGDSLLAVQLVAQLRKQFNAEISTHTLLQHLTVRGLVNYLIQRLELAPLIKQRTHDPLVRIREGMGPHPLFLVHAAGGHAYMYYSLARALRLNVPVYGLQAQGVDGGLDPLVDLVAMAQQYVTAIRTAQPTGPYFLAGACVGGVIAFEMAQQLRAIGEQVALVGLIDAYISDPGVNPEPDDAILLALMISLGDDLHELHTALREIPPSERLAYVMERKSVKRYGPELSADHLNQLLRVFKAGVIALWKYTPRPYAEPLTMLHAESADYLKQYHPIAPERTWAHLATGGMDVHTVPGNHFSMLLPPNVEVLADKLAECMVKAGQRLGLYPAEPPS